MRSIIRKPTKNKSITIKVTPQQLADIKKLSGRYAGGNMSFWLCQAGLRYRPRTRSNEPEDDYDTMSGSKDSALGNAKGFSGQS